MPFDIDAFLADVLKAVPEDQKQTVEEAIRLEAVQAELGKGYQRQSDYSRNMDELTKAKQEAEAAVAAKEAQVEAEKTRYTEWYQDANQEYQAALRRAEAYEKEYGNLENFDPNAQHSRTAQGLSPEELQQQLAAEFERRDRAAIDFADALTDAKIDYRERFGEKLEVSKLYDHVEKTKLPFRAAYEDFIRPQVETAQKAKFEEALKQAKEEGILEGKSQAHMPVQPDPSQPRPMDSLGQASNQEDRVAAASAAFRQAQLGTS